MESALLHAKNLSRKASRELKVALLAEQLAMNSFKKRPPAAR
ncbi:hypothetical protein [Desulfoluna sp.]|nr:hypothetical protein [Desulfoluna sp.]